jgi:tetratricopeptide (TPR) repeat protein
MKTIWILLFFAIGLSGQSELDLERAKKLYYQGKDFYYDGDYKKAELAFDSSRILREKHLDTPHEDLLKTYVRIGNNHAKLRNYVLAERNLKEALDQAILLFGEKSSDVAGIYVDLGVLEGRKRRYSKSMKYNQMATEIRSEIYGEDSKEVAYIRMNNCNNYYSMGNYIKCINEYQRILKIYDTELDPDDQNYNRVYLTMSNAYRKKGDLTNALFYAKKALEIKLLNYDDDHPSVGKYYANVAKIEASLDQLDNAKINFEKAIKIEKKSGDESDYHSSRNDAARVYLKSGDIPTALEIFKASAAFFPVNSRKYLIAKENMATCYFYTERQEEAIEILKAVKDLDPEPEGYLTLSEWSREMGRHEEAKEYLELARSFSRKGDLLNTIKMDFEDALQLSFTDLTASWTKIQGVITSLTKLRRQYLGSASKNYINERLENIFDFGVELALKRYKENNTRERLEDLYSMIEMAKAASFWDNLSEENAAFYGKVPLEVLEEIELLKDGEDETRIELEEKFRMLEQSYPDYYRVKYALEVPNISEVQQSLSGDMALLDYYVLDSLFLAVAITSNDLHLLEKINNGPFNFDVELAYLADKAISRVSVVPHRSLYYESFERLVNPSTDRYLLFDFAFSYQVNVEAILKAENAPRTTSKYLGLVPEFKAQFADASIQSRERNILVDLPAAVEEVEVASRLFDGEVLKGFDATEDEFYKVAPKYDLIHFATHAQIDPENELNSYLFMSPNEGDEDGVLYTDEIMKTDINAAMVVLSACETGGGGLSSGEGVMSLSRAFQYAGAQSVLMSLWRANDQSSKPIILGFLENYQAGMPKDVALQQSKISYLKSSDPLMRDEFYWAGFMINGDLSSRLSQPKWIGKAIVMLAVFAIVFLLFRFVGQKSS